MQRHPCKQANVQRVAVHAHLGGGHGLPCLCLRLPLLLRLHNVDICAFDRLRWARHGVGSRRAIAFCVFHFLRLLLYVRHVVDKRLLLRNDDRNGLHKGWLSSLQGSGTPPSHRSATSAQPTSHSTRISHAARPHLAPVCVSGCLPAPVGPLESSRLRAGAASQRQDRQSQPCTVPAAARSRGAVACRPGA